jgi:hypothetical protein
MQGNPWPAPAHRFRKPELGFVLAENGIIDL